MSTSPDPPATAAAAPPAPEGEEPPKVAAEAAEKEEKKEIFFGKWPLDEREIFHETEWSLAIVNLKPVVPGMLRLQCKAAGRPSVG